MVRYWAQGIDMVNFVQVTLHYIHYPTISASKTTS
jgi:hypothetical protein